MQVLHVKNNDINEIVKNSTLISADRVEEYQTRHDEDGIDRVGQWLRLPSNLKKQLPINLRYALDSAAGLIL